MPEHEKAPVSHGKTGALMVGTRSATRTQDLLIKSECPESSNISFESMLQQAKNAWTVQRAVSHDKPSSEPDQEHTPTLFSDLAAIVASWPSVPEPIRDAVKAVLAPYMST